MVYPTLIFLFLHVAELIYNSVTVAQQFHVESQMVQTFSGQKIYVIYFQSRYLKFLRTYFHALSDLYSYFVRLSICLSVHMSVGTDTKFAFEPITPRSTSSQNSSVSYWQAVAYLLISICGTLWGMEDGIKATGRTFNQEGRSYQYGRKQENLRIT